MQGNQSSDQSQGAQLSTISPQHCHPVFAGLKPTKNANGRCQFFRSSPETFVPCPASHRAARGYPNRLKTRMNPTNSARISRFIGVRGYFFQLTKKLPIEVRSNPSRSLAWYTDGVALNGKAADVLAAFFSITIVRASVRRLLYCVLLAVLHLFNPVAIL